MKKRALTTALQVSPLGLGTVKFGRNQKVHYPASFTLPTDKEILTLLDQAQAGGINLLDTAPAYGESEIRLGKLLQGSRHQWVISTKAGEEFDQGESYYSFSRDSIIKSVERSLQRLHTDYLDIVLIHSNGDDMRIIEQDEVFITLADLQKAGKIRAYGMSTKTVEGGLRTIDASDVAMVTYNPAQTLEKPVINYAYQQKKGIFIKKAFASGHLDRIAAVNEDPIKSALQFIFAEPGVTSVILGTINPEHLAQNLQAFNSL
jgi:aryl-alcohol dehydrogenase-like predicted oxidoreductase